MFFKNLCILVLWTKVASALEGLKLTVIFCYLPSACLLLGADHDIIEEKDMAQLPMVLDLLDTQAVFSQVSLTITLILPSIHRVLKVLQEVLCQFQRL